MSLLQTPIISIDAMHDLLRSEQPVRFDDRPFAMDPFGFNGVQPGAFPWQATRQDAHPLPGLLPLVMVLPQPRTHLFTDMPRRVIPDQQHSREPLRRQPCTAPGEKSGRLSTDRAACHKPQPHLFRLVGPMADQQPLAGQGFGDLLGAGQRELLEAERLVVGCPTVERGLGQAPPPDLIAPAQGPGRMGDG
jgi:hypothetical protein